jgi:N-acylneuraminate cytidylyltransferase/CMP-N,N'-diacetyllegionaminic acid synthase
MESEFDEVFDYVVLLEPTSPLRKKRDVDNMIFKLNSSRKEYDGIVSVGEVKENPAILKKIEGANLFPYDMEKMSQGRRQDNSAVYFPYGVAYIVDVATFRKEKSFYPKRLTHYLISPLQCFEIDDINDFLLVELVMKNFGNSL